MTVSPQFKDTQLFSEGLAAVKINSQWGYIDPSGSMVR
ncbi:MAG: WG repeat-containing protein [Cyanobacteriota bacterium]|nr:WG repeat-containing protein [Cyanobacteriota bacterium]